MARAQAKQPPAKKPDAKTATTKAATTKATTTKAAAKKAATAKQAAGAVAVPDPPAAPATPPQGSKAAYDKYLPIAQQQFPADTVKTYNFDPALGYQNSVAGVTALAPYQAQLAKLPAPLDLAAMKTTPTLALAVMYAAAQVDLSSPGTIAKLRKTAGALRDVMLSNAVSLMKAGTLPARDVQRIAKGAGGTDSAQDCVDLAHLFTVNADAVKGKTPITQAQIDEARSVGDQLLRLLKPKNAPSQSTSQRSPAVVARDQLGALLMAQHQQHVRRAGMWIWVDDVDAHVPPLHSHAGHRKAKTAAAPAAANGAAPAAVANGAAPAAADATAKPAG